MRQVALLISSVGALGFIAFAGVLIWDAFPGILSPDLFASGYWDFRSGSFHALAMIFGSLAVSAVAMTMTIPIGLGSAIYLSEYTSGKFRSLLKILIELLAGIPSVVYGLIGVTILMPLIYPVLSAWDGLSANTLLTGGLLLGFMTLPTMITFADDAMRCVPWTLRQEGLSLGLSKIQVIFSLVIPRSARGILGATGLCLGRALGETIAIYLVIGRTDQKFSLENLSLDSLLSAGHTLTTKLSSSELSIAYGDSVHWQAMMSLALVLWCVIIALTQLGRVYSKGFNR